MKSNSTYFQDLRQYLNSIPLVDCHDHSAECGPAYKEIARMWFFDNPNKLFNLKLEKSSDQI